MAVKCLLFTLALLVPYGFLPESPAQDNKKTKTSIFKEWRYLAGEDQEVIRVQSNKLWTKISGPGLPVGGMDMEKKIAKVHPGPTARRGRIIVGPDELSHRPYWNLYWFDLGSHQVKMLLSKKSYSSLEAAQQASPPELSRAKVYRALSWGL